MKGIEQKATCLRTNALWQPLGISTIKDALIAMASGASLGLDVTFTKFENGEWDFETMPYMIPVSWEEWVNLPIRDHDEVIHTSRLSIRVPTIIIAANYKKMPMKHPKPTRESLWRRDKGKCQYTGKSLSKNGSNIDHIVPVSRGGKSTWKNMVICDRQVNSEKADRTPAEANLKLIKTPVEPKAIPVSATIRDAKRPEWSHFINK